MRFVQSVIHSSFSSFPVVSFKNKVSSLQGQSQLDILDARIEELVKQGAVTLSSNQNGKEVSPKYHPMKNTNFVIFFTYSISTSTCVFYQMEVSNRESMKNLGCDDELLSISDLSDLEVFLQNVQQAQYFGKGGNVLLF